MNASPNSYPDAPDDEPCPDLSPYEVVGPKSFEQGGMGTVWKVRARDGRLYAAKVVRESYKDRHAILERFKKEIKSVKGLNHPNVVRAIDHGETVDGRPYMVMEYVDGQTLEQYVVARRGGLPAGDACWLIRQAAQGLQYIHERNLVHRDIKPSNLMITEAKEVKILDLGLARLQENGRGDAEGERITRPGTFLGTPRYAAPEQAVDARNAEITADIYSLGRTFLFLLSGRPPGNQVLSLGDDAPPGLDKVIRKMTETEPADRYQTPLQVVRALEPFVPKEKKAKRVPVITVMGTKGGAGKSTFVIATAELIASKKINVVIIDADLLASGATTYLKARAGVRTHGRTLMDIIYDGPKKGYSAGELAVWDVTPPYLRRSPGRFGKISLLSARLETDRRLTFETVARLPKTPEEPEYGYTAALDLLETTVARIVESVDDVGCVLIDSGADDNPIVSAGFVLAQKVGGYGFVVSHSNPDFGQHIASLEEAHRQRYPGKYTEAMHVVVNSADAATRGRWVAFRVAGFIAEDPNVRRISSGAFDFEGVGLNQYFREVRGVLGQVLANEHVKALLPDEADIWVRPFLEKMASFPEEVLRRRPFRYTKRIAALLIISGLLLMLACGLGFWASGRRALDVASSRQVVKPRDVDDKAFEAQLAAVRIPETFRDRLSMVNARSPTEWPSMRLRGVLLPGELDRIKDALNNEELERTLLDLSRENQALADEALKRETTYRLASLGAGFLGAVCCGGGGYFLWLIGRRKKHLQELIKMRDDPKELEKKVREYLTEDSLRGQVRWVRDEFRAAAGPSPTVIEALTRLLSLGPASPE